MTYRARRLVPASAVGVVAAAVVLAPTAASAAPTNDNFAAAQGISRATGSVAVNTAGATLESGEPPHTSVWDELDATTHSVWYRWTAPVTGRVEFSTSLSVVDIYTGTSLTTLAETGRVCDDSDSGWSDNCKRSDVVAGTVYRIAVTGYEGSGQLRWRTFTRPANDDFSNATVLSGLDAVIPDIDDGGDFATAQAGEPRHRSNTPPSHSVWYRWTATWTSDVTIEAALGFEDHEQCFFSPTDIVVYTGSSLTRLTPIARVNTTFADGVDCEAATVSFRARAGTPYRIAIDSVDGVSPLHRGRLRATPVCGITGTIGKDTLTGTPGNDVLCGAGGDDRLRAAGGDDYLDGGPGIDAADYATSATPVRANLTTGIATGQGTDSLHDVENLVGSPFADKLDGNGGTNVLNGGGGNDGLWGQAGNDTLLGAEGNDTMGGGLGNDRLNGGTGMDIAHFGAAPAVTVNLTTGSATGEGTDILSLLESITGSSSADRLTGSAAANALAGGGGNDILLGEGGNDSLTGAGGLDSLTGGPGTDRCDGGADRDTAASCETLIGVP